eukprot:COSAG06_NODE_38594_length_421_cov_53.723602_1_plen_130_part_01
MRLMMNRQLHGAFSGWAESVAEQKHMRTAAHRIMSMMMNRQLYAALASWMEFVADMKHMRTAGGRVMRLMMNRQLHGAFSGWAESVAEQLYLRDEDRRRESVRHLYSLGSKTDASCSVTQSRARLLLLIL